MDETRREHDCQTHGHHWERGGAVAGAVAGTVVGLQHWNGDWGRCRGWRSKKAKRKTTSARSKQKKPVTKTTRKTTMSPQSKKADA